MMRVQIDDKNFEILFRHVRIEDKPENAPPIQAFTECEIVKLNGESKMRWSTGYAICSVKDQFRRATGRKIALTRAVACFRRDQRTQIWNEYWKKTVY